VLAQSEDGFYTTQIKDCGYHHSFVANLFVVLALTSLMLFIWILILLKDWVCRGKSPDKRQRRKTSPFCANFKLRFLYEVSFEICLCTIIYLSHKEQKSFGIIFVVSVLFAVGLATFLIFCLSLGCCHGPYVKDSYARGTFWSSFWAIRPINEDSPPLRRLRGIRDGELESVQAVEIDAVSLKKSIKKNSVLQEPLCLEEEPSVVLNDDSKQSIAHSQQPRPRQPPLVLKEDDRRLIKSAQRNYRPKERSVTPLGPKTTKVLQ